MISSSCKFSVSTILIKNHSFCSQFNCNDEHYLQDSSGIFWDNDSLAALLALELKADLLVLLSDVDGLYSGPPRDPDSKLIYTYIKEIHERVITFGDKSRVGRGGMTAKVKAAMYAAYAGIPVVITRYDTSIYSILNFNFYVLHLYTCLFKIFK